MMKRLVTVVRYMKSTYLKITSLFPGPSHTDHTKVRRHEETAISSPRKEEDLKFKFTKFPVRKTRGEELRRDS
ncbi:hypothetical protein OS493_022432 [Desmophyllum pertusum]|uniref:Uncharacterized protein n=1 Tax=Desmophyllum pertusum TaxID=174260 RepID=A0A9W9ZN18_9CNID|nr:hypothetical protein OS493_022432 [Desmophyllum pertusum]